jgi:hypothetical protein
MNYLPGGGFQTPILLISASRVAGIIGVSHRAWFYFVFGGTRISSQSFILAKQAIHLLSNTSSPFCSGYFFGDGIS